MMTTSVPSPIYTILISLLMDGEQSSSMHPDNPLNDVWCRRRQPTDQSANRLRPAPEDAVAAWADEERPDDKDDAEQQLALQQLNDADYGQYNCDDP